MGFLSRFKGAASAKGGKGAYPKEEFEREERQEAKEAEAAEYRKAYQKERLIATRSRAKAEARKKYGPRKKGAGFAGVARGLSKGLATTGSARCGQAYNPFGAGTTGAGMVDPFGVKKTTAFGQKKKKKGSKTITIKVG